MKRNIKRKIKRFFLYFKLQIKIYSKIIIDVSHFYSKKYQLNLLLDDYKNLLDKTEKELSILKRKKSSQKELLELINFRLEIKEKIIDIESMNNKKYKTWFKIMFKLSIVSLLMSSLILTEFNKNNNFTDSVAYTALLASLIQIILSK